ncbi:uncharacterized protein LOC134243008 isoform X1 [Saccostrea cucullata]|uniref:uncharacterized protein LOC134243008 isoform X1 n=1 Tax=Saccostrea cuccullata TaxID=36930 RepID=UPI002ED497F5
MEINKVMDPGPLFFNDCLGMRHERKLGPLETMYHVFYTRGVDIYAQMATLLCKRPVELEEVSEAMVCLLKRHPMLRMTIKETGEEYPDFKFVEMDPVKLDIQISYNCDKEELLHEESCRSFAVKDGPLWRLTIVNNEKEQRKADTVKSSEHNFEFSFVFCFHHSLADGIYLRTLFADFIEFLDMVQKHSIDSRFVKEIEMLPAIESLLPLLNPNRRLISSECSSEDSVKNIDALRAYEVHFNHEIEQLRNRQQSTKSIRSNLPSSKSKTFLHQCKQNHVTVTGACIAASCIAFCQLIKASIPNDVKVLNIPVEIMVNMRRYTQNKNMYLAYPGVAAVHLPLTVKLPLGGNLQEHFWYLAKQCTDDINNMLISGYPLEYMSTEVAQEINKEPQTGKSPYVLCITNMYSVDGIVKPNQRPRFQLKEFPAMTQIGIDEMPIFYVGILSMAQELHLDIGHCQRYTSQSTAAKFSWNVVSMLQKFSSL